MSVLAILLLAAAGLALWSVRRAATPGDYFAAGHRAGVWLTGLAGTAAAVSGFTFVGGPGLFAVAGAGSLWLILSAPVTGALQCWLLGERIVTGRPDRPLTIPSLLGQRFRSPGVAGVAALVVLVGCVASLAVQARAAAVLGEAFLGLGGGMAAAAVMAATTLYTAAGGMRAGLWADAVQGGAMALIGLLVAVAALAAAGGPTAAVATLAARRPELLGSFGTFAPGRAASLYLLFAVGTLAQPHYIQKFLFLRHRSELRWLPAVLTGALAAMLTVWLGVGVAGTALAADGRLTIARPDDLTPRVVAYLGPWAVLLAGLAVMAAMMSTAASFLNLAAAAATRDLPQALGRSAGPVSAARGVTVVVAIAATAAGASSGRTVAWLGVLGWGFFCAALLPVITVGLAWPGSRAGAAAAAMVAGGLADLVLEALRVRLPQALEPGLAGAAIGLLIMVAGSLKGRDTAAGGPGGGHSPRGGTRVWAMRFARRKSGGASSTNS